MRSCGLRTKRAWTRWHVSMSSIENRVVFTCCIAVFLAQASYRLDVHQQHVGARIKALISLVNRNFRAHVGTGSLPPTSPDVNRSQRRWWRWNLPPPCLLLWARVMPVRNMAANLWKSLRGT